MLRRRIQELEEQLGTVLMTRHVDGIRLTPEGSKILVSAERMEVAAFDLTRTRDQAVPLLSGEVKIAVTEGLGTFWLAPRLVEFQRGYPRLIVDLNCGMRSADVLRMEADASVQLTQPTAPDLKVVKLGRLHSMPYASRSYIDTYGAPKRFEEIFQHRIVLQMAEQTTTKQVFEQLAGGVPQEGFVAMRTNVSSAHYWAIAKGAGIGWLPTYASAIGARIVPLDLDLRFSFDIWLTYHPEAKRIPRIRRSIEWIVESFDARHFPWFRDEFIHPKDLPQEYKGQPLVNWFEGFAGAS
ncbi:DNA-binding transcriptional LysR family regulator [Microvirga flocculans]|uniref:DNA-binding transcriptional LysR family regulator n=1 Tax=Microvirga flocculans TaxID=217168 RepID=A0A7W6IIR8_9HYPH|nr:DNA-binding transcriptional LysR family regulator [Microvirga flocculans]